MASSTSTPTARSKFFRIAVEGATTDGRKIERDWIAQMAAAYSPQRYGARVNLEHLRGVMPDGPFKAYGDVIALEAREEEDDFEGKLGLYAQISPTPELVTMNKARQKIYTSCEIDPSFADTKQAYLVGLAVTDSPASLGTDILTFAAQHPDASPFAKRKRSRDNLFSIATEAEIVFETFSQDRSSYTPDDGGTALLYRIGDILGFSRHKFARDDSRFSEFDKAIEALARHGAHQGDKLDQLQQSFEALQSAVAKDREAFNELHTQLSNTRDGTSERPLITGQDAAHMTDC
ncbi:hypothetical protein JOE11_003727 [Robbsia andropogonis]|uniref:GPO family capsid scaffolding protein n=1 Tax=Robbsia andropogonis TaxID=28092 RepID=UPI003D1B22ED